MRLCLHYWWSVAANDFRERIDDGPGRRRTRVLKRCVKCGRLKVEQLDGAWTLEQLTHDQPA